MPDVDFMVVCEHVRQEGGVLHMLAAGLDQIGIPAVPSGCNLGVGLRLTLTRAECGREHEVELIFQNEDGLRLSMVSGRFSADYPDGLPPGWPAYAGLALNLGVPVPEYGVYSLELLVDGQSKKSISLRFPPPQPALPPTV